MGRQFATVLLAVGLVLPAFLVADPLTAADPDTIEGKAFCKLDGTSSGCCLGKLRNAIDAIEGVVGVEIDAEEGTATIDVKEGATVSVEDIKEAVAEADKGHQHGFKVIEIKEVEKEAG